MGILRYGGLDSGARLCRPEVSLLFLVFIALEPAMAEINRWTKPSSGDWEEPASWSLGVLPDPTQSVAFTNAGWKALAIGVNTARNFPAAMQIQDLVHEIHAFRLGKRL